MIDDLNKRLNGVDLFGEPIKTEPRGPVADKFGFPPFSVLDARQGDWQDRKRAWLSVGIKSEVGRADDLTYTGAAKSLDFYRVKEGQKSASTEQSTSIFDPVLCECMYRWFCPAAGQIVDPFAGGSVRGIVAGMMGRKYWGVDLRTEQVDANNAQSLEIAPQVAPEWVCGDSLKTLKQAPPADFIFSCPPYGDLEKYSDNPEDLSNMEWHTFVAAYSNIILQSVLALKQNRFACFVVGDFRDKKGFYRDFVSRTINAFQNAQAKLYNEAILVTMVASASMRVTKHFDAGRKLAKTHQNVLVFCKGDWKAAANEITKGNEI